MWQSRTLRQQSPRTSAVTAAALVSVSYIATSTCLLLPQPLVSTALSASTFFNTPQAHLKSSASTLLSLPPAPPSPFSHAVPTLRLGGTNTLQPSSLLSPRPASDVRRHALVNLGHRRERRNHLVRKHQLATDASDLSLFPPPPATPCCRSAFFPHIVLDVHGSGAFMQCGNCSDLTDVAVALYEPFLLALVRLLEVHRLHLSAAKLVGPTVVCGMC